MLCDPQNGDRPLSRRFLPAGVEPDLGSVPGCLSLIVTCCSKGTGPDCSSAVRKKRIVLSEPATGAAWRVNEGLSLLAPVAWREGAY